MLKLELAALSGMRADESAPSRDRIMGGNTMLKAAALMLALQSGVVPAAASSGNEATAHLASKTPAFDAAVHVSALDALLVAKDYKSLRAKLDQPKSAQELRANLDWLGMNFRAGESAFVAFIYGSMLNAITTGADNRIPRGLKETALAALLYAAAVASIEAQQCGDITARSDRAATFAAAIGQSGLLSLEESSRESAAYAALGIERVTWDRRKTTDDTAFLCSNGMAAISAGLRAGAVREVKPQGIGRQMIVTPPAGFKYERLRDEVYWKKAEEMRARLPETIMRLAQIKAIPDDAEIARRFGIRP